MPIYRAKAMRSRIGYESATTRHVNRDYETRRCKRTTMRIATPAIRTVPKREFTDPRRADHHRGQEALTASSNWLRCLHQSYEIRCGFYAKAAKYAAASTPTLRTTL